MNVSFYRVATSTRQDKMLGIAANVTRIVSGVRLTSTFFNQGTGGWSSNGRVEVSFDGANNDFSFEEIDAQQARNYLLDQGVGLEAASREVSEDALKPFFEADAPVEPSTAETANLHSPGKELRGTWG